MADDRISGSEMRMRAGWGIGIALGMGVGVALGTALSNMALGIGIGVAVGVAFAVVFAAPRRRDSATNDQAQEPEPGNPAEEPDADEGPRPASGDADGPLPR